jgi:hypothetical protein
MDVAVPICAAWPQLDEAARRAVPADQPIWTLAGRPALQLRRGVEIDPHGLEEHTAAVQVLDVREPEEIHRPLGHIRTRS